MKIEELKKGLNQYIETTQAPQMVFISIMCIGVIVLSPHDVVERALSKSGFTAVYLLILCILGFIGNMNRLDD